MFLVKQNRICNYFRTNSSNPLVIQIITQHASGNPCLIRARYKASGRTQRKTPFPTLFFCGVTCSLQRRRVYLPFPSNGFPSGSTIPVFQLLCHSILQEMFVTSGYESQMTMMTVVMVITEGGSKFIVTVTNLDNL
jgi:hypothetical protein